ncbi:MBL fold metallo-hydrolase [Crocinitomix algicola]|uniref:MBL fold metallo-hydrolase n=1 Tax=Crocinitomix algicola TaxID=1740263 RepID=UPI00082DA804|nr:MBL fold metallo-hydrolase [Crocinitomix algicola]
MSVFKAVFLGTGTSQGVPVIACKCEVCQSEDERDKRLRTSLMFTIKDKNYVIDTGPDFRQQMLREKVDSLDAILFTHEHKDHIAGMDDVRAFNFASQSSMEVYASPLVEIGLKKEFHYVFGDYKYPGIPQINLNIIGDESFKVGEETVTPINVMHYKLPVKGFRIRDFVYITDANFISEEEFNKLKDVNVLVLNALRKTKHISHFSLDEAIAIIKRINPKKAYLTHISHLMGKHAEVSKILPNNVEIAYDGLQIDLNAH